MPWKTPIFAELADFNQKKKKVKKSLHCYFLPKLEMSPLHFTKTCTDNVIPYTIKYPSLLLMFSQRWNSTLTWKKEDYGGLKRIWINNDMIFYPDITLYDA